MSPEVVIVGGGPAGLAAAIALGRHRIPTWLFERRGLPCDKACGEGLLPNGVAALERLGLDRRALGRHGVPMAGIRYYSPSGRLAETRFSGSSGFGIGRAALSALLVSEVSRWPDVTLHPHTRAEVQFDSSGPRVGNGAASVRPRLVIGADGLRSRVAAAAGIGAKPERAERWGMRQHFDVPPWSDQVEVHFARGYEVYITPLRSGINVAVIWDPSVVAIQASESAVLQLASRLPRLASRLAGAATAGTVGAGGPFLYRPTRRVRNGLLLVGDAGGYLDAITGEGVGLAVTDADLLERTVVPQLLRKPGDGPLSAHALRPFTAAVHAAHRPNRQLTRLLVRLARSPRAIDRVVSILAARPALFAHCLDVNMGRRDLWRLPWQALFPSRARVPNTPG